MKTTLKIKLCTIIFILFSLRGYTQFSAAKYDNSKVNVSKEITYPSNISDDEIFTVTGVPTVEISGLKFFTVVGNTEKPIDGLSYNTATVASGLISIENFGAYIKKNEGLTLKIINSAGNTLGTYSFKLKDNIGTTDGKESGVTENKTSIGGGVGESDEMEDFVADFCNEKSIRYDRKTNQYIKGNVIHVFVDKGGNYIKSSMPTMAREDQIYVFHVVHEKAENLYFKLEYTGEYKPKHTVYGADASKSSEIEENATGSKKEYVLTNFGAIGPFTGSFTVKIKEVSKAREVIATVVNESVDVAELHHISLNAGLFGTYNRNPQNISIFKTASGDSTLTADDPKTRGMITVMLTFYPKPRNLLFPVNEWKERIGFVVGTSISKNLAENFFGGISYDLARGIAVSGGVHYGRVSYVVDKSNFKFGVDKFTGSLDNRVKMRWDAKGYIGVTLDFRLLGLIFKTSTTGQ